jgi:tetratricopeptide (TPR) repeat protein
MPALLRLIVLGCLAATPAAYGGSANYADCADREDGAGCLARKSLQHLHPPASYAADLVIRNGLVDQIPQYSRVLARFAKDVIDKPDLDMDRSYDAKSWLAAAALLTSGRYRQDPFADPRIQDLVAQTRADVALPLLALRIWIGGIEKRNSYESLVTFAGMRSLWEHAWAQRERFPESVYRVGMWLNMFDQAGIDARTLFRWFSQRPGVPPARKVELASGAANLGLVEEAEDLLRSAGDVSHVRDIDRIRADIAAARLRRGYEPAAAKQVIDEALERIESSLDPNNLGDCRHGVALERAGAREELRTMAAAEIQHAQKPELEWAAPDWYAEASDCYLRAGDRARAVETARIGLSMVPRAVRSPSLAERKVASMTFEELAQSEANSARASVIALYRAGAVDEAVHSGFLDARDRFENAARAGVIPDPMWIVESSSGLHGDLAVDEALKRGSLEWTRRALAAFESKCPAPYTSCNYDTWGRLGAIAAALGDETRMKQIFRAAADSLNFDPKTHDHNYFFAREIAGRWGRAQDILLRRSVSAAR